MNYIFGEFSDKSISELSVAAILAKARVQKSICVRTPVSKIISVLAAVGELWKAHGNYYERALEILAEEKAFSREMIESGLRMIPTLLSEQSLLERIRGDFENPSLLDDFTVTSKFNGAIRFVPHGILLNISAGNVFLGVIDSLILGLVTKNISLIKLSSSNQAFPVLFAESILAADSEEILAGHFALIHWQGGNLDVETPLVNEVDAVIVWGGEEMVASYRKMVPSNTPLIEHGPKFSFQVVTLEGFMSRPINEIGLDLARDITMWDQSACASPQNLLVQRGVDIKNLMRELGQVLENLSVKRGALDLDESVEILKEEQRAKITSIQDQGSFLKGTDWFLHNDPRPGIRTSPLNRTLIIKSFQNLEDLVRQLEPGKKVLQSCSYLLGADEKKEYLSRLAEQGVLRFSPLGTIMDGLNGTPHDGRLSLMELGRLIPDEGTESVLDFVNRVIRTQPSYQKHYGGKEIRNFGELIPVKILNLPAPSRDILEKGGLYFSSGGTTGSPKYVFFSNEEIFGIATMLAKGFIALGIKPGDLCTNLFVAGNLWSSFLVVQEALKITKAVQLPIGGMADPRLILEYLEKFKPKIVFGLPSLLVELASLSESLKAPIRVQKIFYAGEHLSQGARNLLSNLWGVEEFHSAGYASVDAGPVGYQCSFSGPREHHVFEEKVHLEIIDNEGYVTSLVRESSPVIHLKTGDHLEWLKSTEVCPCGRTDRRFILHGRIDSQMRIWSSRILQEEVEKGFQSAGIGAPIIQIVLENKGDYEAMRIKFEVNSDINKGSEDKLESLKRSIYENCRDLSQTHDFSYFNSRLILEPLPFGGLSRVARTGKIRSIVDQRLN